MMQSYKVFYKSNQIVFQNFDIFSNLNKNTHVIINPVNRIIISAINSCFLDNKTIDTLIVLSNKPKKAYESFINSLRSVECAGGLVFNNLHGVLMIKKNNIWDLPKGKVDLGEKYQETAIREVVEETGIEKLNIIKQLEPSFHIYPLNDEWIFKTTYWFLMNGEDANFIPQAEEGITDVKWIEFSRLNEIPIYSSINFLFDEIPNC